ncbi:MAG: ComF family protein [Eubacteriales bacterium]|nr:ComF family protein [Eubacteriales bacterium]
MRNSRSVTALWDCVSRSFLELLYPARCPLCHEILPDPRAFLCPDCQKGLRPISGPVCMRCGKPVEEEQEYCRDCARTERHFDQGKGIFLYDDKMRASLKRYKLQGCREYGRFYGEALFRFGKRELARWRPQLVVPVPLSSKRRRQRGFNQARDLARILCDRTGLRLDAELMKKRRETGEQKKLDAAQRKRNLREAFLVTRELAGERILLVDDVYTTGSTMDAAAACLKEGGAGPIFFLTLCTGAKDI